MDGVLNNIDFGDPTTLFIIVTAVVAIGFAAAALRNGKFLGYIFRNVTRNPVRAVLSMASTFVCLFLLMVLISFFEVQEQSAKSLAPYNRIISMSSQGLGQRVPIALEQDLRGLSDKGVVNTTPFSWFGGKLGEEQMPFAQFGVNPEDFAKIYGEFTIPEDQLKNWLENKDGCLIGYKLAAERGFKVGDKIPLKGDIYPVDLDLTVQGIYQCPKDSDPRTCFYHWSYLDEKLKQIRPEIAGNAGVFVIKCKDSRSMASLSATIDAMTANTQFPTRTQTEEAFSLMFVEMWGDLKGVVRNVGFAAVLSLICAVANTMAMALRERTTEVAVLKAIGFSRARVFTFVTLEALIVTLLGGLAGSIGAKLLFDSYDLAAHAGGFLAAFFVAWPTALLGLSLAFWIGLASGLVPAIRAATLPVVQGLRKVV